MKKFLLLAFILGIAIAGYIGLLKYKKEHKFDEIKQQVSYYFKDPSSTQFRGVVRSGGHICGEVNAKNGFGAYGGFHKFYVELGILVKIEGDNSELGFKQDFWDANCAGAVSKALFGK